MITTKKDANTIIAKVTQEFFEEHRYVQFGALLEQHGIEFDSTGDLYSLVNSLEEEFFDKLMDDNDFLLLSVLRHYVVDDTHIFALDLIEKGEPCPCCGNTSSLYHVICVSPRHSHLSISECNEINRVVDTSYEYVFDIKDLIESYNHADDASPWF